MIGVSCREHVSESQLPGKAGTLCYAPSPSRRISESGHAADRRLFSRSAGGLLVLLGGAFQAVMRGSGARRGGPEQCADQPARRVTGGSGRPQAAVQVWRGLAGDRARRSLWCANWQAEARVTYRRRRSDLCPAGILPSDGMFLIGSPGGLSACRTGEAPKPVPAAALISSRRSWWLLAEMASGAVARCRRGRAAGGRT